MKELKKLALILRNLGISAFVDVSDKENIFLCVESGKVAFHIWKYGKDSDFMPDYYEVHYYFNNDLVTDQIYSKTLKGVVKDILNIYYKPFE